MTARQQGRCSRRSAVALASNIITYFAYMRLHLQFHWLCGMLSSCGAVELWSCESLLLCCPQSGKKAKQKKRRTCAASHPHRWLVAAWPMQPVACCCCCCCCWLHAPTIASFWANEKQFRCSNYVSRGQSLFKFVAWVFCFAYDKNVGS